MEWAKKRKTLAEGAIKKLNSQSRGLSFKLRILVLIVISKFINRHEELSLLEDEWNKQGGRLVILYGTLNN